jgi:hypothetical protein
MYIPRYTPDHHIDTFLLHSLRKRMVLIEQELRSSRLDVNLCANFS